MKETLKIDFEKEAEVPSKMKKIKSIRNKNATNLSSNFCSIVLFDKRPYGKVIRHDDELKIVVILSGC